METNESIGVEEASAALASVRESRARVAWQGYPAWYWLASGAGLSIVAVTVLLPGFWDLPVDVVIAAALVKVAHAAGRARGVCEGWVRAGMTWREGVVLYGPSFAVLIAAAFAARFDWWTPWSPIAAAVLAFALFTGAGFALSARAAHR